MGQGQSTQHHPSLGAHGPHLQPRRGRRINWWEAMKLGAISVGVGALQWVKVYLMSVEHDEEEQRRRRRRNLGHRQSEEERAREKGLAASMHPQTRRALIGMIDDFVTPVLVDQWRLGLVKVLLDPEEGPVLLEEDPDLRKGLLESLQTYQASQDRQPTFTPGSVPARYAAGAQQDRRSQPGGSSARRPTPQPPAVASGGAAEARSGAVLSADPASAATATPSAPPLYPTVAHPSAPILADPLPSEAGPSGEWEEVEAPEECGVCLDSPVEVAINDCSHKLCCECAKAICCLEGRSPQCPFCRGAMTGVSAI